MFPVIFTTAYDKYLLDSFEFNSIDYLLKPITEEKLLRSLGKLRKLEQHFLHGNLQKIIDGGSTQRNDRLVLKKGTEFVTLRFDEIAYFFSDGRLNFFKTNDNKKFVVDYTMDELEDMLDTDKFFRISRAFFVAVNAIEKIDDYFGNRLILQLNPVVDKEALVSREKVTDFKRWMGK